jgi:hypothetical protein
VAYSQFHDGFWTDPEIRQLSSDDKMILIWFITNPDRHYSGIYFFELESIGKQTGLPEKTVRKGIDTLSAIGFIKYNPRFSMVWVRKMARHEVKSEKTGIYSEKQTKGIANHFEKLHKCPLIKDFLEYYPDMNISYTYGIRQEEVEVEVKEEAEEKDTPLNPPQKTGKKSEAVKTTIPDNFGISDEVRLWAGKKGFTNIEAHLEWFIDYARSGSIMKTDWDAFFRNAIRQDWGHIRERAGVQPKPPSVYKPPVVEGLKVPVPNCQKCGGRGICKSENPETGKYMPCTCLHPKEKPHGSGAEASQ